jgi:hypothetical protein
LLKYKLALLLKYKLAILLKKKVIRLKAHPMKTRLNSSYVINHLSNEIFRGFYKNGDGYRTFG